MARYPRFDRLDGAHPFKSAVPGGYVDYPVRRRPGGGVFLFNFDLAREMGLLPEDHPDRLDPGLRRAILETFGLEIVNEYDQARDPGAVRRAGPRRYMATRYLQLQHPGRQGRTSGDGRSIWNGVVSGPNGTWDVSSCGTGATRLSPATAIHGRFFRTGDPAVSYGCGRAALWDAVCAAMMSEVLHGNGIRTERTLAIIDYGDGTCVAVRAGRNLLRPAHLFHWLKQGDLEGLRSAVEYYIARESANGAFPRIRDAGARYRHLAERVADDFARMAARFEHEYIFCWLDWDGDNILLDGGIIDYGSVRQFGLFHREYRYDDVDRMSTTITGQRRKARYIVQTMAQLVDFLCTGRKAPIRAFADDPAVRRFDAVFEGHGRELLLQRTGFDPAIARRLAGDREIAGALRAYARDFACFERTNSRRGAYRVSDGITRDAVFCMRDLLRELPLRFADRGGPLEPREFIEIMRSSYAGPRDVRLYPARRRRIARFQASWHALVARAAQLDGCPVETMMRAVAARSAIVNRRDRITGDGVLIAARHWLRWHKTMNHKQNHALFRDFVRSNVPCAAPPAADARTGRPAALRVSLMRAIHEHRHGL